MKQYTGCQTPQVTPPPMPPCKPPLDKPPLGIMPKHIHDMDRILELERAIYRYIDAESAIPVVWIEEYNELIKAGVRRVSVEKGDK